MLKFTLTQRVYSGSEVIITVEAESKEVAIQEAEETFDNFLAITYMSLKEGIANPTDPEFWAKRR